MKAQQLPIPDQFDAGRVGEVWRVPYAERAAEAEDWAARHRLHPAAQDESTVCLLIVDCQNTFCIPDHELFVAGRSGRGAVDDNVRLCEFIYRNLGVITQIAPTLDTHTTIQIFNPIFWVDAEGRHPSGGRTVITAEDVERGVWRVNPTLGGVVDGAELDYLERHVRQYVQALSEGGKYPLLVWPYHAMLGGIGHALVSAVDEAVFFHSVARSAPPRFEIKGRNPLTEHYSVLGAEVLEGPDGARLAEKNAALIESLLHFDAVVIAGQAKSHCVAWTVRDLLAEIRARDAGLARKIYLLEDCTSPVVIPGAVDFTDQADSAFAEFADAGMHVVRSTAPLDEWVGLD